MEDYCLPKNYNSRKDNQYFDDTPYKDEFQDDVYQEAKKLVIDNNYNNILDIGTGSGYKLIKYFNEYNTIGVDLAPTILFLMKTYPNKTWCELSLVDKNIDFDLIICSDVIEHINDLNSFLLNLNTFNFKKIIFSTPDKFNMYQSEHLGPPSNPAHVREWTMKELNNYLSKIYNIEKHFKSNQASNTQIIVCSKK